MKYFSISALAIFLLLSCTNVTPDNHETLSSEAGAKTGLPYIQLDKVDSIEALFYPRPENQKNYNRLMIDNRGIINKLSANLMQDTVTKALCAHNVKLYFFKGGDVFKTVYAATAADCRYFAYAVNSRRFFTGMNSSSFRIIDSLGATLK